MIDELIVEITPLSRVSFAPFGQVLSVTPDEALIELRESEAWVLNVLSYDSRPLRCDHLNAHRRATQMLLPLAGGRALIMVAASGVSFHDREALGSVKAFVLDGSAAVNLALGTWHWGPYPLDDHVDLLNLQGRGFVDDNEVAHLERDLGVVLVAR